MASMSGLQLSSYLGRIVAWPGSLGPGTKMKRDFWTRSLSASADNMLPSSLKHSEWRTKINALLTRTL